MMFQRLVQLSQLFKLKLTLTKKNKKDQDILNKMCHYNVVAPRWLAQNKNINFEQEDLNSGFSILCGKSESSRKLVCH